MSWSVSGSGHIEVEADERRLVEALALAIQDHGGDSPFISFSGRFVQGDVATLVRQFESEKNKAATDESEQSTTVPTADEGGDVQQPHA